MPKIITGSPNLNDTLVGTKDSEILVGRNGMDRLLGKDNKDILVGDNWTLGRNSLENRDFDLLSGDNDNDILIAGDAHRVINKSTLRSFQRGTLSFNRFSRKLVNSLKKIELLNKPYENYDALQNIRGGDALYGQVGNDLLIGDNLHDALNGGAGNDTMFGLGGNDNLQGVQGDDRMYGGAGNDYLATPGGNNLLVGGSGNDRINAGSGRDTIEGGKGNDRIDGNGNTDILVVDPFSNGDLVSLGIDTISDIEVLRFEANGLGNLTRIESNNSSLVTYRFSVAGQTVWEGIDRYGHVIGTEGI